jgi:hypothetical protein
MKRYVLCAPAAVALAVNAEAVPKDKPPVVEVPKDKDKDKYNGPVASVPDNGNTALLLGTAVLALGIASRRFATR